MTSDRTGPDYDARLLARFGRAAHDPGERLDRARPPGLDDDTVAALGKLSEALEVVEQARGLLYGFHRLCGTADLTVQEAVRLFREAGHLDLAAEIEQVLVGGDLFDGRWSFQIVEDYDREYWQVIRETERYSRERLGSPPHLLEAEMKCHEQH